MNKDAHYYGVLAFSRASGFKKEHAWDVAYASQFVDDAKVNKIAVANPPGPKALSYMKRVEGAMTLYDMATCHSYEKIKTFNYSSMISNTIAFHFVPGCDGANFPKKLRCRQGGGDSHIMDTILAEAIKDGNLIKLGIVLHAYADTFSHQGFSGLLSKVNDINKWKIEESSGRLMDRWPGATQQVKKVFLSIVDEVLPAYGHAQAMHYPDLPYLSWSYRYDRTDDLDDEFAPCATINNTSRFKEAFSGIQDILRAFLEKHPKFKDPAAPAVDVNVLFDCLVARKSDKGRIRNWVKAMKSHQLFSEHDPMLKYDEAQWLKNAFTNYEKKRFKQRAVTGAIVSDDFEQSKWFEFYKAAHWYKDRFFNCCSQAGIDLQR